MFEAVVVSTAGMIGARGAALALDRWHAVDALEHQELLLRQVIDRIRLAQSLAEVQGADWSGPAARAFETIRHELRQRVAAAVDDTERALAATRDAIAAVLQESP